MTAQKNLQSSSLPLSDLMLLSQSGSIGSAVVEEMLKKAKKTYVESRHNQAISQMRSTNKYKNGKWKTYYVGDTGRKEIIRDSEEAIYETLFELYKQRENRPATVEDVFNALMERKRDQLGRSQNTIDDSTRYFSYISDAIKKKPIAEVAESDLRKWFVKSYMPTMPREQALRKMLQLLKQIFRYGMQMKVCFSNPAEYILFDDYAKDCNLQKKTDEERAFSKEEIKLLTNYALTRPQNPRAVMSIFAAETGMRVGEMPALLWDDISDEYIHVHRQQIMEKASRVFSEVSYTKDERKHPHNGRMVPITKGIKQALSLAKTLPGESKYVFHDKNGLPITKESYAHYLTRACKKLGIQISNNHAYRIAFNSRMIECGLSPADRALILGHAVQTNEHHYSVSDKRRLADIKSKML